MKLLSFAKSAMIGGLALFTSVALGQFSGTVDWGATTSFQGTVVAAACDSSGGDYNGYVYVLLKVAETGGPAARPLPELAGEASYYAPRDKSALALLSKAPAHSDLAKLSNELKFAPIAPAPSKLVVGSKYAVIAYNSSGTYEWGHSYPTTTSFVWYNPQAITVNGGNVYCTGYCNDGLVAVQPGGPTSVPTTIYTIRIPEATPSTFTESYYNNTAGGSTDPQDFGLGIATDSSGNVLISGAHAFDSSSPLYIQVVGYTSTLGSPTAYLTTYSGTAPYICRNKTSGVVVEGTATISSNEYVYVGGYSYSAGTISNAFNDTYASGSGVQCQASGICVGNNYIYAVGYNQVSLSFNDFVLQIPESSPTTVTAGGTNTWSTPYVVAADGTDHVYVAGISNGIEVAGYAYSNLTTAMWTSNYAQRIKKTTGIIGVATDGSHVYVGATQTNNIAVGFNASTGALEAANVTEPNYAVAFAFNSNTLRVILSGTSATTGLAYTYQYH